MHIMLLNNTKAQITLKFKLHLKPKLCEIPSYFKAYGQVPCYTKAQSN